jgi:hypothetical protein
VKPIKKIQFFQTIKALVSLRKRNDFWDLAWIRDALAQIEAASFLFFFGYEVAAFAKKK